MSLVSRTFLEKQREALVGAAYAAAGEMYRACDTERIQFGAAARERIAAARFALATALDAFDTIARELERITSAEPPQ